MLYDPALPDLPEATARRLKTHLSWILVLVLVCELRQALATFGPEYVARCLQGVARPDVREAMSERVRQLQISGTAPGKYCHLEAVLEAGMSVLSAREASSGKSRRERSLEPLATLSKPAMSDSPRVQRGIRASSHSGASVKPKATRSSAFGTPPLTDVARKA